MLTASRLRQLVIYDPVNGTFTWRFRHNCSKRWNTRWAGKTTKGSPHNGGYTCIAIDHTKYLAHRLAWLYVYGTWPRIFIDHINLDKKDNRFSNLREADYTQNSVNISQRNGTVSGHRGVYFHTKRKKWVAIIHSQKKAKFLGYFKNVNHAAEAYEKAAIDEYGEYCPLMYK